MKHPMLVIVCVIGSVLMASPSLHAQKDVKDDIVKANERFASLFAAGDATAFVEGVYTEDARIYPPNSPVITGQENIATFWGGMMEAGITPRIVTESAHAYGKIAIEEGTVGIYAGDNKVDEIKYILIWKNEKGTWKIQKDIWNSNTPAD